MEEWAKLSRQEISTAEFMRVVIFNKYFEKRIWNAAYNNDSIWGDEENLEEDSLDRTTPLSVGVKDQIVPQHFKGEQKKHGHVKYLANTFRYDRPKGLNAF